MIDNPIKLTPWHIFSRYRIGPRTFIDVNRLYRESISVVIDPYNTTHAGYEEILTNLKKELFRRINRDLYQLVKRSVGKSDLPIGKSRTYLQLGRKRIFGGMYMGVLEDPTVFIDEDKFTLYVTFKSYVDPKEVKQICPNTVLAEQ